MSLTLDTPTCDAIKNLRGNANFDAFINGLTGVAHKAMLGAISSPPDLRIDQTAYARGLRDMLVAVKAVSMGLIQNQVAFPAALESTLTSTAETEDAPAAAETPAGSVHTTSAAPAKPTPGAPLKGNK